MQPDTLVPDPSNPQAYDRYSYVFNDPARFTDPSGHTVDRGLGENCESLISDTITKKFKNVKIKNPRGFTLGELDTLNATLNQVLAAFNGNVNAFNNAFGDITFEMKPNGSLGGAVGQADWSTGNIQLEHSSFSPYYDVNGWAIAHEMGHLFDARWSGGDPKKYYSNLFVEVLNGGCQHLTSNGCLGSNPPAGYPSWYYFGQDIGDYDPASRQTTGYGLAAGSMEDFAESFAATVLGDPHNYVHPKRKFIVQTYINLVVSSFH